METVLNTAEVLKVVAALPKSNHQFTKTNAMGFVRVRDLMEHSASSDLKPKLVGILAPGNNKFGDLIGRYLVVDSRAPEWFRNVVFDMHQGNSPVHGMKLRVRISGRITTGFTAFVMPCAKNLEHAVVEWKREVEKNQLPETFSECKDRSEFTRWMQKRYADMNHMDILHYDERTETAVMIDRAQTLHRVRGAGDIWNFTGGIEKGTTTLVKEIERCMRSTIITHL